MSRLPNIPPVEQWIGVGTQMNIRRGQKPTGELDGWIKIQVWGKSGKITKNVTIEVRASELAAGLVARGIINQGDLNPQPQGPPLSGTH